MIFKIQYNLFKYLQILIEPLYQNPKSMRYERGKTALLKIGLKN